MKINGLNEVRYYGVTHSNVKLGKYSGVFASSTSPELLMPIPYLNVVAQLKQHFAIETEKNSSTLQQFRNHLSALNGFLAFCGKTVQSNVGAELTSQFDAKLNDYLKIASLSPRTQRDRARQLRAIRRLHQAAATPQRTAQSEVESFSDALRRHVANSTCAPASLAKEIGVPPSTLGRWLAGAKPSPQMLPAVRRLESKLALQRETLVSLLVGAPGYSEPSVERIPAYGLQTKVKPKHNLTIPESQLSPSFVDEWRALFDYKVSSFPSLERQASGRWRLIPKDMSTSLTLHARRGSMVCPTAALVIARLRSFLGVIFRLPLEEGGLAWNEEPTQTLAFCAHPRALECYLNWVSEQSNGVRHEGQKVFAAVVANLLRPGTGYLWQQATVFRNRLPDDLRPATDAEWRKMCEDSHKLLRDYIRSATGTSRHPEEPIASLLALPDPFKPVLDAIDRIQAAAAGCPPGGISQARHKRDALLLALLLSNPLRLRTVVSLTFLSNGQGSLRGTAASGWRIVLQPMNLKNGNSQRSRAYNVKVADWVKPMLDEYIEEYRETLLAGRDCPYLFFGDRTAGIWEAITHTVRRLTRRYIPDSPGFGPHAFRHLVATTWLRKNPGDFLTVAELLNDTLATVLANYAHLRRDDSFARYEAQMAQGR